MGNNPIDDIKHSDMVAALAKSGITIKEEMTSNEAHLIHMMMGVCGEAGELLDAIKKSVIYNKVLDIDNVIEELGDIEFYMEGLRQGLKITRDETIQGNIKKLATGPKARYKAGSYSDDAANARADKT